MASRRALLIGVEEYEEARGFRPLPVVRDDILAMREALEPSGYMVERVVGRANRSRLLDAVSAALIGAEEGDTLTIYYSGHGVYRERQTYLVPSDGGIRNQLTNDCYHPKELAQYLLPLDLFNLALSRCKASTVLFLIDACREGLNYYIDESGQGSKSVIDEPWTKIQHELADHQAVWFVFSCSPGRYSSYSTDSNTGKKFSFFTRVLSDILSPAHPARTYEQVLAAVRERLPALIQEYGVDPQEVRDFGEGPTAASSREICEGDAAIEDDGAWLEAVRTSCLWIKADDLELTAAYRDAVFKIVARCRREYLEARELFPDDPWLDSSFPVRTVAQLEALVTQFVNKADGESSLFISERALLLCAPFVREAVFACARKAVLSRPDALSSLWKESPQQALCTVRERLPQVLRQAEQLGERGQSDEQRAVAGCMLHYAFLRAMEVWIPGADPELPQEILVEMPFPSQAAVSAVAETFDPQRVFRLAWCVHGDPDRISRKDRFDRSEFEERRVLSPHRGQSLEIREHVIGALLCLTGWLSVDVRTLSPILVGHIGLPEGAPLEPRSVVDFLSGSDGVTIPKEEGQAMVLQVESLHPVIDRALGDHLELTGDVLKVLRERIDAREAQLDCLKRIPARNERGSAVRRYARWIYKRYQRLDLVEITEIVDVEPISLRQVYVPMRVGTEDIADEDMGKREYVAKDKLPGMDAWALLAEKPWVALTGPPGSGKTTLVQAIVMELCGQHASTLRGRTQATPVPLILRDLGNLEDIKTLEDLLEIWWPIQEKQAAIDRLPLDRPRIHSAIFPAEPSKLQTPTLLLFDGIDEIGGRKIRQQLLEVALEAQGCGYRVLVTGRPAGFKELRTPVSRTRREEWPELQLHHLLPFAWPQIEQFISSWYDLRGEWQQRKEQGLERFLRHLADPGRRHMLALARRPIFLTLMSLVNCTQNVMPEGRALLYKRIVDLYLDRQELHRQRQRTVSGRPMRHWPANETRLVLAHLAWLSQRKGSEEKASSKDSDARRVIWARADLEAAIQRQLKDGPGRFAKLEPDDAAELTNYFLHPAGLLVEPAEGSIQFAHLSFQEYLCALFIHERGKVAGMEKILKEWLFSELGRPGWDEVGILLICIHAEETNNEGHFQLLSWLDLVDADHASLFVASMTGRELSFMARECLDRLPTVLACALIHPLKDFGLQLSKIEMWQPDGLAWIRRLLESDITENSWAVLQQGDTAGLLADSMGERWLKPEDDGSWNVQFGSAEARMQSLLQLVHQCGWVEAELKPAAEPVVYDALIGWLDRQLNKEGMSVLWMRIMEALPAPTNACFELDALLSDRGELWRRVTSQVPVDGWLLQGERYEDVYSFGELSQSSILLAIFPGERINRRSLTAVLLYQSMILLEATARGSDYNEYDDDKERSRLRSLARSRPLSLARSQSRLRSLARSRALSLPQSRSRLRSRSPSLSLSLPLSEEAKSVLEKVLTFSDEETRSIPDLVAIPLSQFGLRSAALDWFDEQASNPDLASRRGMRPSEPPLPRQFGLFDNEGRPLVVQKRASWLALRQWLDDDEAILSFAFPEGLDDEDRQIILSDLQILRRQPWSPQAGIDAMLEDWPADEEERDISLEDADKRLRQACEQALKELDD